MHIEKARRLHTVIVAARKLVDDKTASIAPELFEKMGYERRQQDEEITLIKAGTRINWNGTLKRAAVDIWDTEENNPDNAPALWEDINYKAGHRIIPDVITVGLAFSEGETGWWNDMLYRSKVNANVYTPDTYPNNWEIVEITK
jgi:hypothetical protein